MIELRTGIPRSGKSLSAVEALYKLMKRWETHPQELRPVYSNIENLALVHQPIPVKTFSAGGRQRTVPDWDAMPNGSIVIIDECQDYLPPRSSQTEAPPHIAWLNTHGHKGFDIWLMTQHPKLIDFGVRALVGKHMHYRRLFGGQRAAVYEWDACSDNLGGMKEAVMSFYFYPKSIFHLYKSADIHTKQSFKLPRWVLIPVAGVIIGAFTVPKAIGTLRGAASGQGLHAKTEATAGGGAIAPIPKPSPVASAPVAPASQVKAKPRLMGCIAFKDRCECFGDDGQQVETDRATCEDGAQRVSALPLMVGAQTAPSKPAEAVSKALPETNPVFVVPNATGQTVQGIDPDRSSIPAQSILGRKGGVSGS